MTTPTTPTLTRKRTTALFHPVSADGEQAPEPVIHAVLHVHQDELNAERQARGYGIDVRTAPLAFATLVSYVALVRAGHYGGAFQTFKNRDLVQLDLEEVPVDPTRPSRVSDSPSPSDSTGPAPTGSEPTTP